MQTTRPAGASSAGTAEPATARRGGTSRFFKINLWLHRWSSLVATPLFLVLCITGTILIFHEEIDSALGYVPRAAAAAAGESGSLSAAIATAQQANPGLRVLSAGSDPDEHPNLAFVYLAPPQDTNYDHAKPVYVQLSDARLLDSAASGQTPTDFLLELHANWFLGLPGELIGAVVALLVLVSLVSGMVVYAPYVRRIFFGVIRRGRGTRLLQLDLHNFIGAVVLGWCTLVSFTGVLLGFGSVAFTVWQMTELQALKDEFDVGEPVDHERPPVSADVALKTAATVAPPGWTANTLFYPGMDFSTRNNYTVLLAGEGLEERLFRIALVDARSGQVATVRSLPWYLQAIQLSQPLHFGDYGGLPLKLLWTACTWLTLFITGNGAWLWWSRRRKTTAPAKAAPKTVTA